MSTKRFIPRLAAIAGLVLAVQGAEQSQNTTTPLVVTVGKSMVLDSPLRIQRISIASGDVAEAVAVNPREVLINGKMAGETSLVMWQQGGPRLVFDLTVRPSTAKLDRVREQIAKEMGDQDVSVFVEGDNVFLHGKVRNLVTALRAANLASTLGTKVVNLLKVEVPPQEEQILLKVRFADVDRSISSNLGWNLISSGATNTIGQVSTQQFSPPGMSVSGASTAVTLSNLLNIFLYRPDLNLGATIQALQAKNLLQILAEPNVLAMNGKEASFLAGGEFPVPVVQGGSNIGTVTIQFREFGVRINFLPTITPRGTIRLQVTPEVSSLDYSNATILQGFTIPAIATRRVHTEIELESGQSFGIAGLLDNRLNETVNKIPALGDIPLLGKLFQSRTQTRNNSELLVMVTPEFVRSVPADQTPPALDMPKEFLQGIRKDPPRTPGVETTGPAPMKPKRETVPYEELLDLQKNSLGPVPGTAAPGAPQVPMGAPVAPPASAGAPVAPANGSGQ